MTRLGLPLVLTLSACAGDETLSAYARPGAVYALQEIDGAPFAARATLRLPGAGQVAGEAPCNQYSARLTVPHPWFALDTLSATERACPDLQAEAAFFAALSAMTLAETAGEVLILSNDDGREMVFRAE